MDGRCDPQLYFPSISMELAMKLCTVTLLTLGQVAHTLDIGPDYQHSIEG